MISSFNTKQLESLSTLFFDIAKGLVLGIIGVSTFPSTTGFGIRIFSTTVEILAAYFCIRIGLKLLKEERVNAN